MSDQSTAAASGSAQPSRNAAGELIKESSSKIALSTSSVYPETTSSAFELARKLGYDGVEVMVGIDPVAADVDAVEKLRDYHGLPVVAIHAPCLLITQRVWGTDPWAKLERSAEAARQLDADVVVVHPPFRWQRDYARGFIEGIKRLTETTGVTFCVENMYPWRTPGGELKAYLPGWDPTERDYADLTLDLSHASTSSQKSLELAQSWGARLKHVHLTDGMGSAKDEHLVPGRGDQDASAVLEYLAETDYSGHVVLEINSRKCETRAQREEDLAESLAFARLHLTAPIRPAYAVDAGGEANVL